MTLVPLLRRQPLLGYFVVAYGISWGGILVVLSFTCFDLTKLRPLDTGLIFIAMLPGRVPLRWQTRPCWTAAWGRANSG